MASLQPITVERLLSRLPRTQRHRLPRVLSERRGASLERSPTIHAAMLTLDRVAYQATGKGWDPEWAANLPQLTIHYAAGWQFAYANFGATSESLVVYLWKPAEKSARVRV